MATLLKWEKETPEDFYSTKTHMWILIDGKVRMSKKCKIHAEIWGEDAWGIDQRGYYNDNYGIVTCHGKTTTDLERMLAKKFPRAMYIRKFGS
jgi:hypothetical protein